MCNRNRVVRWAAGLALLVGLTLSSGCLPGYYPDYGQECAGPGDLQIRWVFDASPVCPVKVSTIVVELTDANGAVVDLPGGKEFDCTSREVVLSAMACGTYNLLVKGTQKQDDETVTTYLSSRVLLRVQTGRISPVTVNLLVAP